MSEAKCPVTDGDRNWVDYNIDWIFENLLILKDQKTIGSDTSFVSNAYSKSESDAQEILNKLGEIFGLDVSGIELVIYSEAERQLGNNMTEVSDGAVGLYVREGDKIQIWLEVEQLDYQERVIATLAHELSHYELLQIKKVAYEGEENEFFTDLYTITKGLGIFLGNTKCLFDTWEQDGWSGWRYSNQGYLPLELIAYSMARMEFLKNNIEIPWEDHMGGDFGNLFFESLLFLYEEKKQQD